MAKRIIHKGDKFGRLEYIKDVDPSPYKDTKARNGISYRRRVLCRCECGNEKVFQLSNITNGHTKSCGCYNIEIGTNRFFKHGLNNHPLRKVYDTMKYRCNNPSNKSYSDYGGRGISVCEEWEESYIDFYNWAISNGYKSGLSIDRIDNDKGYSPENCRFASKLVQANNTRRNVYLFVDGVRYSISQFSRKYDIGIGYIKNRLKKGISGDMILVEYGLRC